MLHTSCKTNLWIYASFLHGAAFNFIQRVAQNLKGLILRVRLFRLNRTAGRSDFLKTENLIE